MRLQRFFIEDDLRNKNYIDILDNELIHQLKDVFRLRAGQQVVLLDNTGYEYLSEIILLARGKASIKVIQSIIVENVPNKEVWLYASLIKKDNYEWILEKCTELGVSHFVPVMSDRSEKKDLNIERSVKIIKEASEQSGRGLLPELHQVITLGAAVDQAVNPIAFHTSTLLVMDQKNLQENKISLFIGPEGGWSDKEIKLFELKNVPVLTMGRQVLRAETAAIVASASILI